MTEKAAQGGLIAMTNNGKYHESNYEEAFLQMLVSVGYTHIEGQDVARSSESEVLYMDDIAQFITRSNPALSPRDVAQAADKVRMAGGEDDFATLHSVYGMMVDGVKGVQCEDGKARDVMLIDYDKAENNIFRAVNQLPIEYTNNGVAAVRRPDILIYLNGMPVCIIELKNPADEKATIEDAWRQIYTRYWRDIPHLLHYCPLACISDGTSTRLGTVRTPFEHFYSWRRVNSEDKGGTLPFNEMEAMIKGVYEPSRFLEIFRDYIYFQDSEYDKEGREIVCRYPQFFAARLLKESIVKSITERSKMCDEDKGKGGTYFGATGCGKTYTMMFLARQLALRCTGAAGMGSPTIVMIVDREDLQNQGARLFTKSKDFLCQGEVNTIKSRSHLRQELKTRQSGGFYICTIQKFCDREDDKIGVINERSNIVCFSDEAHRTQLSHSKRLKIQSPSGEGKQGRAGKKGASKVGKGVKEEERRAFVSKAYVEVLREAFPNATFVGFTGTPIDDTYKTFGDEVDRYTMDQAVADGITVPIKYHPRIAKVTLDKKKIAQIEAYYKNCYDEGASEESIEKSKQAMSSMEIILKEPGRLERLAADIHDHYTAACDSGPSRVQKAMIVCSSREIAFALLQKFKAFYPEWFIERKTTDDSGAAEAVLNELKPMPFIAMVASAGKDDEAGMYNYLGGVTNGKRSDDMAASFKDDRSNLHIAIVVDMWITGFDVPSLTYLYNDKPLQKHTLIQTISRVNRKYPGKDYGMLIDYIGIRGNMRQALKMYEGEGNVAAASDDVESAAAVFRSLLETLKHLFTGRDIAPFMDVNCDEAKRYTLLYNEAEYVFKRCKAMRIQKKEGKSIEEVPFRAYFLDTVQKMRFAFDICFPAGGLGKEESTLAQCFMAIAGMVRKMAGTSKSDTAIMNRKVAVMVAEALRYNKVENLVEAGKEEDIFSDEYTERLSDVAMPATKLELLIKLLQRQIKEYGKTNQIAAKKYEEWLKKTIDTYHERREKLPAEEAGETQEAASEEIIQDATEQALDILRKMKEDRASFRKMALTFEEKAFYDILMAMRDKHNFEYGTDKMTDGVIINDKCASLARKVKAIIDIKSQSGDWLNNQNVRNQLKFEIKVCLVKAGYPPQYSPDVFRQVMKQVENYKENN